MHSTIIRLSNAAEHHSTQPERHQSLWEANETLQLAQRVIASTRPTNMHNTDAHNAAAAPCVGILHAMR